jgi:pimeloyl-ACP methyl ester carboxylesterase
MDWLLRWPLVEAVRWLTAPVMPLRPDPDVVQFLSAASEARNLRVPLAVIHGTDDRVIPITQGQTLFAAAGTPLKRFVAVPGTGHLRLDYTRPAVSDTIGWVINPQRT